MIYEPTTPPARMTTRPAASYGEYVRDYSRLSAWYGFLIFAGIAVIVGAGVLLSGKALLVFAAAGLGIAGGGGAGLLAVMAAHAAYTRHLSTTTTTTYTPPAPPSPRAFIPSQNGRNTINVAAHWLTDDVWRRLVESAGSDGKITRDRSTRVLSRRLYRNWQSTIAELQRLGLVDDDGIITPAGTQAYTEGLAPRPAAGDDATDAAGTHARRTHGGAA